MRYLPILLLFLTGCLTNEDGATQAIKQAGYHPIKVGGYCYLGCSEDDTWATRFEAYSADSTMIVKGCVCEGLLKGKTIRLD